MLIKCICKNCAGHLEFEEENAGEKIKCPHCGFNTTLYLPGAEQAEEELATLSRKLRSQKLLLLSSAVLLASGGIVWCLYHWGIPVIEDQFPSVESTTVRVLILLGFCVGLILLLTWLILPIVAFFEWRRLLRSLARIERVLAVNGSQVLQETIENTEPTENEVVTQV